MTKIRVYEDAVKLYISKFQIIYFLECKKCLKKTTTKKNTRYLHTERL